MDEPPGLTRYLPWAAGIAILFVFGIAWAFGLGDWGALQTMLAAPPGELSSVARTADGGAPLGARVYHGKLFGPAGRVAPNGRPAAIYRAWVEPTDEDADGEYCVTAAHDGVWLEGDAGVFPLGWLEGNRDVPLFLADGVVGPSSDATVIEAPGFGKEGVAGFPAPLDACAGSSRASHMSIVPPGVEVDVLACARDGALVACPGAIEDVVSVGRIDAHRRRRADGVANCFRVACAVSLSIAAMVAVAVRSLLARAFERLRTERR